MDMPISSTDCVTVDAAALRAWPLPMPSCDGDKEQRGHVLILGGSRKIPGAVILAATAALRTGAGKLTIATGASVAQLAALALADKVNAILIGRGTQDEADTAVLARAPLPRLEVSHIITVLDA